MNKNVLSFLVGAFATIFVGGGAILAITIALRTNTLSPVAPTVPQIRPRAEEPAKPAVGAIAQPTAACQLTFTVAAPPVPICNSDCQNNNGCPTNTICSGGKCRNPSCTGESSCSCPQPSKSCNTSCTNSADCPNELACVDGRCRNTACTSQADCKCPPPPKACNETCLVKEECTSGMTCAGGHCRNVSCITAESCVCPIPVTVTPPANPPVVVATHQECRNRACVVVNGAGADTCSSDVSCQPVAAPPPIPKSGMELPTIMAIVGGVGLVIVGLLVL